MSKSCKECPSFMMSGDRQQDALGTSLGVNVCGRLGHVLNSPKQTTEQYNRSLEQRAEGCASFGEAFEWTPVALPTFKPQMFLPDPSRLYNDPNGATIRSCTTCDNYVVPGDAYTRYGVSSGVCAAQGTLVLERQQQKIASTCEYRTPRKYGANGATGRIIPDLTLLPEIDPHANVALINMQRSKRVKLDNDKHGVDPREYVSDRPVTSGEAKQFIRAWRFVEDPEGIHPHIEIPIFDGPSLAEAYQIEACKVLDEHGAWTGKYDPRETYNNFRPDLYIDHQGMLYDLAAEFFTNDKVPVILGPAGGGKSELGCWFARILDVPFHFVPIDKETMPYELLGESTLTTDHNGTQITQFEYGTISAWVEIPCVMMIDEPNLKADVFPTIRPLVGASRELPIKSINKRLKLGKYTWIMISQNPAWLPEYVGTETMNAADLERMTTIYMPYPDENIEREIITSHCEDAGYKIPDLVLGQIMSIGRDIREQILEGHLPLAWGIRSQIKVAMNTRVYSLPKAYRRAVLDGIPPEQVDVINPIIASVVG